MEEEACLKKQVHFRENLQNSPSPTLYENGFYGTCQWQSQSQDVNSPAQIRDGFLGTHQLQRQDQSDHNFSHGFCENLLCMQQQTFNGRSPTDNVIGFSGTPQQQQGHSSPQDEDGFRGTFQLPGSGQRAYSPAHGKDGLCRTFQPPGKGQRGYSSDRDRDGASRTFPPPGQTHGSPRDGDGSSPHNGVDVCGTFEPPGQARSSPRDGDGFCGSLQLPGQGQRPYSPAHDRDGFYEIFKRTGQGYSSPRDGDGFCGGPQLSRQGQRAYSPAHDRDSFCGTFQLPGQGHNSPHNGNVFLGAVQLPEQGKISHSSPRDGDGVCGTFQPPGQSKISCSTPRDRHGFCGTFQPPGQSKIVHSSPRDGDNFCGTFQLPGQSQISHSSPRDGDGFCGTFQLPGQSQDFHSSPRHGDCFCGTPSMQFNSSNPSSPTRNVFGCYGTPRLQGNFQTPTHNASHYNGIMPSFDAFVERANHPDKRSNVEETCGTKSDTTMGVGSVKPSVKRMDEPRANTPNPVRQGHQAQTPPGISDLDANQAPLTPLRSESPRACPQDPCDKNDAGEKCPPGCIRISPSIVQGLKAAREKLREAQHQISGSLGKPPHSRKKSSLKNECKDMKNKLAVMRERLNNLEQLLCAPKYGK